MPSNEQRRENAKRKLERQLVRRAERARRRRMVGIGATVVGVLVVVGVIYLIATLSKGSNAPAAADTSTPSAPVDSPSAIPTALAAAPKRPTPLPATATCAYPASTTKAAKEATPPPTANISATGTVGATIATNLGDIKITLDRALAPCTVNSFVSLAKQGYFNETSCHRLTTGDGLQVLQCGDPSGTGSGGPGYSFNDEVFPELKYGRGILAMANGGPNTNGSQFFIVYGNAELPPNYTAFGTVDEAGLKLIDQVAMQGTLATAGGGGSGDGAPKTPVDIHSVKVAS